MTAFNQPDKQCWCWLLGNRQLKIDRALKLWLDRSSEFSNNKENIMSAYVLETEYFNQLATELLVRTKSDSIGWDIQDTFGCNLAAIRITVQALANANVDAVNGRYNSTDDHFQIPFFSVMPRWSDVQLLKGLQCLRYQMSEKPVDDTPIFDTLNSFIGLLAEAIVSSVVAEYDRCTWGYSTVAVSTI